jgi:hypothetical protein
VAANLWPELASEGEPTPTIAAALESGARGVEGGRGLLGDYPAAAAAELRTRRDRVLRGLPALREGASED